MTFISAGDRFGSWTVIEPGEPSTVKAENKYNCRCECGVVRGVSSRSLRRGSSKSCGCGKVSVPVCNPGDRFGRWTVVGYSHKTKKGYYFDARCDCGTEREVMYNDISRGVSQSCGCFKSEQTSKLFWKHGKNASNSQAYRKWVGMLSRCNNPNTPCYSYYGGKGITVCDRWCTFENFLEDMGEPDDGMELDRILNSEGYSPENCRWATRREQIKNRDCTIYIEVDGEHITLAEASDRTGIKRVTLYCRYLRGWSGDEIVKTPLLPSRKDRKSRPKRDRSRTPAGH